MVGTLARHGGLAAAILLATSGCAVHDGETWSSPVPVRATPTTQKLQDLPYAGQPVAIAVYNFSDQTGQFKPTEGAQTLSRAVTQGATSILVKALMEAGHGNWFTVIERERLDNVLRERAVIREMRSAYLGEQKINPDALPPLLFAGILLEGGIIGFDSDTKSGGAGARFLGIGGSTLYREDTVTIYLRAVSVKTGEVLTNVSVRKSIASVGVNANAFRYVAFKELLELEAGVAFNEPDALALQQAIEEGVYGLVMEGTLQGLWCLNTTSDRGSDLLHEYVAFRDNIRRGEVVLPAGPNGETQDGTCDSRRVAQIQASRVLAAAQPELFITSQSGPRYVRQPVIQAPNPVSGGAPGNAGTAMPLQVPPEQQEGTTTPPAIRIEGRPGANDQIDRGEW